MWETWGKKQGAARVGAETQETSGSAGFVVYSKGGKTKKKYEPAV